MTVTRWRREAARQTAAPSTQGTSVASVLRGVDWLQPTAAWMRESAWTPALVEVPPEVPAEEAQAEEAQAQLTPAS